MLSLPDRSRIPAESDVIKQQPVETYMINGETRRKIREYVDAHGFGDNREAGALQEMYDRYLVPNCVR